MREVRPKDPRRTWLEVNRSILADFKLVHSTPSTPHPGSPSWAHWHHNLDTLPEISLAAMAAVQSWSTLLPAGQRAEFINQGVASDEQRRFYVIDATDGTHVEVLSIEHPGGAMGASQNPRNLQISCFYETPSGRVLGWMQITIVDPPPPPSQTPRAPGPGEKIAAQWIFQMDDSGSGNFLDFTLLVTFYARSTE